MSDQKQFSGRVAIVTGATRGIGRAIAIELARRGADVAFNYAKSAEAAESLKSEIEALGVRALATQGDVANTDAAANGQADERRVRPHRFSRQQRRHCARHFDSADERR